MSIDFIKDEFFLESTKVYLDKIFLSLKADLLFDTK